MVGPAIADAIFVATTAVFLAIVSGSLLKRTHVPLTVILLLWGLAIGVGNATFTKNWDYWGPGVMIWRDIDAHFLAALLLPPILYIGASGLERQVLLTNWFHILLLGVVGVVTGCGMTAVVAHFILPYDWSWPQSLLFGAIVAATDPVAAVALLKEVGAPVDVRVTVDGEALIDDGVAYVLYSVMLAFVRGESLNAGGVIKMLARQSVGGPAIGVAFAVCLAGWLRWVPQEAPAAAGAALTAAFAAFFVAEQILLTSGILSVVALGMAMALLGRATHSDALAKPLQHTLDAVEYIANALAFVITGIIIAGQTYDGQAGPSGAAAAAGSSEALMLAGQGARIMARDYGWGVALWLLLMVIRVINVTVFFPLMRPTGHGMTPAAAVITAWSGLRGLVGLVLALLVLGDEEIGDAGYKLQTFFLMGITVVLTVVVQGSTFEGLLWVLASAGGAKADLTCQSTLSSEGAHPPGQQALPNAEVASHAASNSSGVP
eukprot:CAMPEP_0206134718 /NCGR_PEP_ID=MMETSP1473-20131121/172_1 /ASSEMBLY_ACC=CAM_ASM_001109 /TAXON_ID=1461547 /ORGANISM="Stichococcus sp, Strain RCC1054" /LENGTH=489 /DNA_ID=CAMNT_0053526339 /DNA_START=204 /DNA_END=1673 /DNA_ORIENTATION=-